MNQPLTYIQAMTQVNMALELFILQNEYDLRQSVLRRTILEQTNREKIISEVRFVDVFSLYNYLPANKKKLFLPGEIGNENITLIYTPVDGCTIIIQSEPCIDYRYKIHNIDINLN